MDRYAFGSQRPPSGSCTTPGAPAAVYIPWILILKALPLWPFGTYPITAFVTVTNRLIFLYRLRSSVVSVLFSLTTKMTAPRSSLVSQFLPPSFVDLCLHVDGHDDLAIAVPACAVRGFAILLQSVVCGPYLRKYTRGCNSCKLL